MTKADGDQRGNGDSDRKYRGKCEGKLECYLAFAYGWNEDGTFSGLPEYRVRMKDETHRAERSHKITRNMANR